jgi:hypothetical protein
MSVGQKLLDAGGPAAPFKTTFVGPCEDQLGGGEVPGGVTRTHEFYGATLLGKFAGEALIGLLAGRDPNRVVMMDYYASISYAMADAMLAERKKRGLA